MATATNKPEKKPAGNVLYIFAYLLTWLSGIIVYLLEGNKDKRLKFHALQAIFIGVVTFVMAFIPFINLLGILVWIYGLYVGVKAYQGHDIEIPVLGEYARKYSN